MSDELRSEVLRRWYGGQSGRQMARDLHLSRKTVAKVIAGHQQQRATGPKDLPAPRESRGSLVDPYEATLRDYLARYPDISAVRLWEELRRRGYPPPIASPRCTSPSALHLASHRATAELAPIGRENGPLPGRERHENERRAEKPLGEFSPMGIEAGGSPRGVKNRWKSDIPAAAMGSTANLPPRLSRISISSFKTPRTRSAIGSSGILQPLP